MYMIFVTLPVRDLARARAFYEALGFRYNQYSSDERTATLGVDENIVVQAADPRRFCGAGPRRGGRPGPGNDCGPLPWWWDREAVDDLVAKATAAGGKAWFPAVEEPTIHTGSFADPDGHVWQLTWMEPVHAIDESTSPDTSPPPPYDPECEEVLKALPPFPLLTAEAIPMVRETAPTLSTPNNEQLSRGGTYRVEERITPGPEGGPEVALLICRPADVSAPIPALYWIHGGGMVLGLSRQPGSRPRPRRPGGSGGGLGEYRRVRRPRTPVRSRTATQDSSGSPSMRTSWESTGTESWWAAAVPEAVSPPPSPCSAAIAADPRWPGSCSAAP